MSAKPSEGTVALAGEDDLPELLELMRAYCDFYRVDPGREALAALARALIADPACEGLQLLAREGAQAVGFATVYWSWSTAMAARIGVMNDLYVAPAARGGAHAERLIEACAEQCRRRGALALEWQTAPDNVRAQAVYRRVGARREDWLFYTLPTGPRS